MRLRWEKQLPELANVFGHCGHLNGRDPVCWFRWNWNDKLFFLIYQIRIILQFQCCHVKISACYSRFPKCCAPILVLLHENYFNIASNEEFQISMKTMRLIKNFRGNHSINYFFKKCFCNYRGRGIYAGVGSRTICGNQQVPLPKWSQNLPFISLARVLLKNPPSFFFRMYSMIFFKIFSNFFRNFFRKKIFASFSRMISAEFLQRFSQVSLLNAYLSMHSFEIPLEIISGIPSLILRNQSTGSTGNSFRGSF